MHTADLAFVSPATGISRRVEGIRRLFLSCLVMGVFGTLAAHGLLGAIDASALGFAGGSDPVSVTSRPDRPMFELGPLEPGRLATSYERLTYRGAAAGEIRLFADVEDAGLARHLTVTVTSGTGRGAGFVADQDGVLFSGLLSRFPTGWADGITGDDAWNAGETRAFRFEVRLSENVTPGATAGATFAWEARPA